MLEQAVIIAAIVFFIHSMTEWDGMIFSFISKWCLKHHTPMWIKKPLFTCPICMTPWWGSAIYWLAWGNSGKEWVIVVAAAAGINAVIVYLK